LSKKESLSFLGELTIKEIFCFEFLGEGTALKFFGLRIKDDCLDSEIG
jgi:hypothetical protein